MASQPGAALREAQATFASDFVMGLAKDCALFAAVLKIAGFLALDGLVSTLLSSDSAVNDDAFERNMLLNGTCF